MLYTAAAALIQQQHRHNNETPSLLHIHIYDAHIIPTCEVIERIVQRIQLSIRQSQRQRAYEV